MEVQEFTNTEDLFHRCKEWVSGFLTLGELERKGFDSVTPYMHCLVYHVPFFTKKYGKLVRFSGQGVEKINDDVKKIHHSKTNKWDATLDALQVRKRIEHLTSENCEREKRKYSKTSDLYWNDEIFKIRSAKKTKISEEMSIVAEKFLDAPVSDSDNDLSISEIREELKKTRRENKIEKQGQTFESFEE